MGGFAVIRFATVARTGRLPRPEGDPNLVASLILVRPDIDPRAWLPAFAPIHLVGEVNSSHAGFRRAFPVPDLDRKAPSVYNGVMPTVHSGHKTLVNYPDGTSKVITLYVRPVEGQIIAHGWEVTNVAPGSDDGAGVPVEYQISVARPANESQGTAVPPSS